MALTVFSEITPLPERASGTKPDADGELWNTRYTEVNLNFELLEGGAAGEFWAAGGGWAVPSGTGSTNGHVVEDEGTPLTQRVNLDFVGGGVTAADGASATEVTIPSSAEEIAVASEKATPVDADKLGIFDSAAAGVLKWLSWSNLKATLKTYFDAVNNKSYTFDVSVSSFNLTVALKLLDGSDPSATEPINFAVGTEVVQVTSALSVTVNASDGDVFLWDAGKIQTNDAQLFVYLVNNNGTPQLGVAQNPSLQTVASVYLDDVGQTGAVTQDNIVMSGTRNATNSCDVIGRVNVHQLDNDNWQSPTVSQIWNEPIYETGFLNWSPTYTGFSSPPTNAARYKLEKNNLLLSFSGVGVGTSNATNYQFTAPLIPSKPGYSSVQTYDNGAFVASGGVAWFSGASRTVTINKQTVGVDNFTASGAKTAWGQLEAEIF